MKKRLIISLCALYWAGCSTVSTEPAVVVSAASSLTFALQQLAASYHELHPEAPPVRLNFGATGSLAQQIRQGAPVDLFAAADAAELDRLVEEGLLLDHRLRFYGRLVIWCPDPGPCPETIDGLARPEFDRIALAHPGIAPYGRAALEALQATGLRQTLEPRFILGQSARAALRYAETGDAQVALTALSLARSVKGRWVDVDTLLYQPVEQGVALVGSPRPGARAFFDFVDSDAGRRILTNHGFRTGS